MYHFLNLLLSLVFLSSCSTLSTGLLKDPTVQVQSLNIKEMTLDQMTLDVALQVTNPNAIPLNLDRVSYGLKFSGEKVTEGVLDKGVQIPASGTQSVTIPMQFSYRSINQLLSGVLKKQFTKDYELSGSVRFGIFDIPYSKKGELKAP